MLQTGPWSRFPGLAMGCRDGSLLTAPAAPRAVRPRVSRVLMLALGLVSTAVSCPPISCPPSPLRLMGLLTCPVRQPSAHLRLRTSLPGNPERPRAKAAGHDAAEVGLGGERSLLSHYFVDGV